MERLISSSAVTAQPLAAGWSWKLKGQAGNIVPQAEGASGMPKNVSLVLLEVLGAGKEGLCC